MKKLLRLLYMLSLVGVTLNAMQNSATPLTREERDTEEHLYYLHQRGTPLPTEGIRVLSAVLALPTATRYADRFIIYHFDPSSEAKFMIELEVTPTNEVFSIVSGFEKFDLVFKEVDSIKQ